ncbi:hypothetical protein TNCV_2944501 [Trichonephila clavipes]|nr:hypothetical protein TNCV_2944501 [Trichonephila clavipes]
MRLKQIKDDTEKHSALAPLGIKRSDKIDSANSSWKMRILFDFHFLKRRLISSEVFRKTKTASVLVKADATTLRYPTTFGTVIWQKRING